MKNQRTNRKEKINYQKIWMGVINGSFVKVFHDKLTSRNIEPFIVSPIFPYLFGGEPRLNK